MDVVYPVPRSPQQKSHDLALIFVGKSSAKTENEILVAYKEAYEFFFQEFQSIQTED